MTGARQVRRRRTGRASGIRTRAAAACLLLAAACGAGTELEIAEPRFVGGRTELAIRVGDELAGLAVWLDGRPAGDEFAATDGGMVASLDLAPGPHRVDAWARTASGTWLDAGRDWATPPAAPALLASDPADAATDVARGAWLRLVFAEAPRGRVETLGLRCDGSPVAFAARDLGEGVLAIDPAPELPAGAACALEWLGSEGPAGLAFATAPAGAVARVVHDRTRTDFLAPFPDDYYLVDDPGTRTGRRVRVPLPTGRSDEIEGLFEALTRDANRLDGWSPIAPLVVETSDAVDPASLPATPAESLDPLASIQLLRLDGEARGARVPFRVEARDDVVLSGGAKRSRTLLLFPSLPLRSEGRYALVVTRRAYVEPGRPLDPSPFFQQVLAPPLFGEAPEVTLARAVVEPAVAFLESEASPRIAREDLALVLAISARSTDDIPGDVLAMRGRIHVDPPPALLGFSAQADTPAGSEVAAVVRGTWDAPDWRALDTATGKRSNVARGADGLPVQQRTRPVEFVLALPHAAESGPVPVIFHQHGNPGSQEEVIGNARSFLAGAGFAVIGFTDILNREVSPPGPSDEQRLEAQVFDVFLSLLRNGTLPDHWLETTAEQLAFLRFLRGLETLDVLPLAAPDGVPDLNLEASVSYHGISEGGNNGQALLPYAPDLAGAALVVGGARLAEALLHQQDQVFLDLVPALFPGLTPSDIWTGLSLFQTIYDRQDPHNQLEFAFRRPVRVDGTERKPSVLVIEGLDDSMVPNHATDSTAGVLGVPHLEPVLRPVPFLETAERGVSGNLPGGGTGAYVQYAPVGLPDVPPTPGCTELLATRAGEGHFCAQSAKESRLQRIIFFQTALGEGPPEIVDTHPLFE